VLKGHHGHNTLGYRKVAIPNVLSSPVSDSSSQPKIPLGFRPGCCSLQYRGYFCAALAE
jgi:hypothetical protein